MSAFDLACLLVGAFAVVLAAATADWTRVGRVFSLVGRDPVALATAVGVTAFAVLTDVSSLQDPANVVGLTPSIVLALCAGLVVAMIRARGNGD